MGMVKTVFVLCITFIRIICKRKLSFFSIEKNKTYISLTVAVETDTLLCCAVVCQQSNTCVTATYHPKYKQCFLGNREFDTIDVSYDCVRFTASHLILIVLYTSL